MGVPNFSSSPPFERGQTWFGLLGTTPDTTSGAHLEGQEWTFKDLDLSVPVTNTDRTNRMVRCRVVRNSSGIALLPKRLVQFKTTGVFGNQIIGYTSVEGGRGYPVDEWLPATGVPNNDLFWIVVEGPATVVHQVATVTMPIAIGDYIVAATAAASTFSTTAGRVEAQGIATTGGATTILANAIQNRIGAAMSAVTTTQTDTAFLCDVGKW